MRYDYNNPSTSENMSAPIALPPIPTVLSPIPKTVVTAKKSIKHNSLKFFDISTCKDKKLAALLRSYVDLDFTDLNDMITEVCHSAYNYDNLVDKSKKEQLLTEVNAVIEGMRKIAVISGWVPNLGTLFVTTKYAPTYMTTDTINYIALYNTAIEYAGAKFIAEIVNGKRPFDGTTLYLLDNIHVIVRDNHAVITDTDTSFDVIKSKLHKSQATHIKPNSSQYGIIALLPQMDLSIYRNAKAIFEALSSGDGKKFSQILSIS